MLTGWRAEDPWRWYAHLTVPATSVALIRKAIERGSAPTSAILEQSGIGAHELAVELGVDGETVDTLLSGPVPAPLVVVDGEDSIVSGAPAREGVIEATLEALAAAAGQGPRTAPMLAHAIAFRTGDSPGVDVRESDVVAICAGLADRGAANWLVAVVLPKVDGPQCVASHVARLGTAEERAGLPEGSIRVLPLIESARGFQRLEDSLGAAGARLGGVIFGVADYAADLGLPLMTLDHPVTAIARARLLEAAAAAGVPAFDGMTMAFPAADPTLPAETRRRQVIDGMRQTYRDAMAAFELGMAGKWVGHPLQLFATELASRAFYLAARVEAAVEQVRAFAAATEGGRGVALAGGSMVDRATDRQARAFLRRAAAAGRFEPSRLGGGAPAAAPPGDDGGR